MIQSIDSKLHAKLYAKLHDRKMKYAAMVLYMAAIIIVSVFHEPWFDEAQAWQIARYASFREILFEVPHYEGHPPLWHLLLAIPAKLGIPFEPGLKTVGLLVTAAYIYLILFKSPFPEPLKFLLPLNYFLFYEYGIIVRPYGLMIFEMLLTAITFPGRNRKPFKFILCLILLCMTHAYGIVISGGIAVAFVIEILQEKGFVKAVKELFKDQRERFLLLLLAVALLLIAEIFPVSDTYIASDRGNNPFRKSLLCMLFVALPDCLLTRSGCFWADRSLLQDINFTFAEILPSAVIGLLLLGAIYSTSKKKNFLYFILPYTLLAFFGSIVYVTTHHIGVMLMLLLFWLWIEMQEHPGEILLPDKITESMNQSGLVRCGIYFLAAACILIPVYWSAASSVNDIKDDYSYGRDLAAFLKENNLADKIIFEPYLAWETEKKDDNGKISGTDKTEEVTHYMLPAGDSTLMAYFDDNLIANNCYKETGQYYRHYQVKSEEDLTAACEEWRSLGVPDVLLGKVDLDRIYGKDIDISDYVPVYVEKQNKYYKETSFHEKGLVYVRKALAEELGLEPIDISEMFPLEVLAEFRITEEMKEQYRAGELTGDDIVQQILGDSGNTTDSGN